MMAVSAAISEQAASLGVSILIGGALFLLYDILRIFRRIVPHGNFWIGMEDFLFLDLLYGSGFCDVVSGK